MLKSKRAQRRLCLRLRMLIVSISESVITIILLMWRFQMALEKQPLSDNGHDVLEGRRVLHVECIVHLYQLLWRLQMTLEKQPFLITLSAFLCPAGRGLAGQDRASDVCGYRARRAALFPDTIERLGDERFKGCESLESVDFGASSRLVAIGREALYESSLRHLAVSDSVERLSGGCFGRCGSLEAGDFCAGSRLVEADDGALTQAWLGRVGLRDDIAGIRPARDHIDHYSFSRSRQGRLALSNAQRLRSIEATPVRAGWFSSGRG